MILVVIILPVPDYSFLLQADVEISFGINKLDKAEVLNPSWTNPQLLCSKKGASVKGSLGPFGLRVLASKGLEEYTAVFYRIFKAKDKYVVLMCSDQSRSLSIFFSLRHQYLAKTSQSLELIFFLFLFAFDPFLRWTGLP